MRMIINTIDFVLRLIYNHRKNLEVFIVKPLTECTIGCEGRIVKIKAKDPIKGRLFSLGLAKGSEIKILDHTLAKQTWEVESDGTKIALREEEAASVFMEPVGGCE